MARFEPLRAAGSIMLSVSALVFTSACGDDGHPSPGDPEPAAPTYYADVGPILRDKCVGCHTDGGIAPFSLEDYDSARDRASIIAAYTRDRVMPPFLIEPGGACGSFDESVALTDAQIETIGEWARAGAPEGTAVELAAPAPLVLEGATEVSTPEFVPRIDGGPLAEFDEYRCFPIATTLDSDQFITGYDVAPGNTALVHHAAAFIVDPNRLTASGQTNRQVMDSLRASDPDPSRGGWSCFGMAGEGIEIESAPVVWAPGQGVVRYPSGIGVPLRRGHQLIVQVHYNMASAAPAPDRTALKLELAPSVEREAVFLMEDELLATLFGPTPAMLEPDRASVVYQWERSGSDAGLPPGIQTEIVALFPHMHERGRRFTFEVTNEAGEYTCQGRVNDWDFHWQRIYQYTTPIPFDATSRMRVTCDYDTRGDDAPTLPGWGTRNEMCFTMLMLALPRGVSR